MPDRRNRDGMVWLTAVTTESDCNHLAELLNEAGIPFANVRRGAGRDLRIVMGATAFGQDFYVLEEDYDEAVAVLEEYEYACGVSEEELAWQAERAESWDDEEDEWSGSYQTFFHILAAIGLLLVALLVCSDRYAVSLKTGAVIAFVLAVLVGRKLLK